jgi:hypothetical protein
MSKFYPKEEVKAPSMTLFSDILSAHQIDRSIDKFMFDATDNFFENAVNELKQAEAVE